METKITLNELLSIARSNAEGFTIDQYGNVITKGMACAVTNGMEDFNTATVGEVYTMVTNSDELVFGGWYDTKEDVYYIDAVKILPANNAAMNFARLHKQRSVFILDSNTLIEL
jgi:hypothetical protein